MFRYFTRLYEKYALPVYPIALFSYDTPVREEPSAHHVAFPDLAVLDFTYRVIQLNRLNWRDFVRQPNPVASALMAKMGIVAADRPKVKLECLRLLVQLGLKDVIVSADCRLLTAKACGSRQSSVGSRANCSVI